VSAVARIDQVLPIRCDELEPKQPVTVSVTTRHGSHVWVSLGTFTVDDRGRVDTCRMPSTAGTYTGRSPMGLFWSQRCVTGAAVPSSSAASYSSTAHVRQHGRLVQVSQVERHAVEADVRVSSAGEGVVGTRYLPDAARRIPVLVLGGSEGGQNDLAAALLAAHGHPTLALTYFGARGLPARLEEVSLDYVCAAARTLTDGLGQGRRFAVYGVSKGAELGLLLGAIHADVAGVAAMVPSFPGVSSLHSTSPPWTGAGSPAAVPMGHVDPPAEGELLAPVTAFGETAARAAGNSVPTLLVTTGDDTVLPPLLVAASTASPVTRVHVAGAGHLILPPHLPATATVASHRDGWLLLGGTPERNAVACRVAWRRTLRFLRDLPHGYSDSRQPLQMSTSPSRA
jgi:hypothetical protein